MPTTTADVAYMNPGLAYCQLGPDDLHEVWEHPRISAVILDREGIQDQSDHPEPGWEFRFRGTRDECLAWING